ncbi:hypothetical protein BS78_05G041000 [Paspalum vaginatum]|nr:hypothetical protein BS78_05G041000 [Paspalum vaginatum]
MAAAAAAVIRRYLRHLTAMMEGRAAAAIGRHHHHQQQLIDSGRALLLFGAITLTHQLSNAEHHLLVVGLMLWLLGAALVTLSLAAPRFPRLAAAGAAIAAALRVYLLGGL